MITDWDDYFIHQTADPILVPHDPAPNFMDRFYWNVHDRESRFAIGLGLGQYRNTSRMDAIAYVLLPEEQRTVRMARRTTAADFADPAVGPVSFGILEPLKRWTWQMRDNPSGVRWDLEFTANRPPVEFAPFEFGSGSDRSDYRHFVQLGTVEGEVSVDGEAIVVRQGLAIRDRSWGVRRSRERQGLHLWLHHRFDACDVFLIYNEARDGSVAYCDGAVVDEHGRHRIVSAGHDLTFVEGSLDVCGGTVSVLDERGETRRVEYDRVLRGYVGGVGYGGWAGAEHPDGLLEAEVTAIDRPVEEILAAQPLLLFDHICRIRLDGGAWTTGSMQLGITRSSQFAYRPKNVVAEDAR